MEETTPHDPLDVLRPFIMQAKVTAFAYAYEPASHISEADELLDDAALRKFFSAYPKTVGDPLVLYIDEHLTPLGFRMQMNPLTAEPVIPVMYANHS